MIRIQVRPNEPLETALRRFKRQCNYAGIFRLAKKQSVYEKPSEKRRREQRERIRNVQRAARKAMQGRKVRRKSFKPRGGPGEEASAVAPTQSVAQTPANNDAAATPNVTTQTPPAPAAATTSES